MLASIVNKLYSLFHTFPSLNSGSSFLQWLLMCPKTSLVSENPSPQVRQVYSSEQWSFAMCTVRSSASEKHWSHSVHVWGLRDCLTWASFLWALKASTDGKTRSQFGSGHGISSSDFSSFMSAATFVGLDSPWPFLDWVCFSVSSAALPLLGLRPRFLGGGLGSEIEQSKSLSWWSMSSSSFWKIQLHLQHL